MSDQPSPHYEYDTATIRQLLRQAFNDEDFSIFCFDHFPVVYKDFTHGMTFSQKVQVLVEHCQQTHTFDKLLSLVKANNPNRYAEFSPLLVKTQSVQSAPAVQRFEVEPKSPPKFFSAIRARTAP